MNSGANQDFLTLWKDADLDIPILVETRNTDLHCVNQPHLPPRPEKDQNGRSADPVLLMRCSGRTGVS